MQILRNQIFRFRYQVILVLSFMMSCGNASEVMANSTDVNTRTVKIALLLDTSGSMDGLIDQAKTQLWTIVNELSEARCEDEAVPSLEIALYEYGNDWISAEKGHIRQVCSLTGDLDLISEKLFALKTNGGNEYCGQVIAKSLTDLEWGTNENDLKLIFIAGNEPFTQGEVNFATSCGDAKAKGIIVNTIFCGDYNDGINTSWKTGADITKGNYMSINHNTSTVAIPTPYDQEIDALNNSLNDTYIPYGDNGRRKKDLQVMQDENAASYSISTKVSRITTKSKAVYVNDSWDLVDGTTSNGNLVEELDEESLPEEMQGLTTEERKEYVAIKSRERGEINDQISSLSVLRNNFLLEEKKKASTDTNTLDRAMIDAIKLQAKTKGLKFEE